MDAAAARPDPIPVYAEMGSLNPVLVLPEGRGCQIVDVRLRVAPAQRPAAR